MPLIFVLLCCNDKPHNQQSDNNRNQLNFDSLLMSKDTVNMIITIDKYINSLLRPGDNLNVLSDVERNFYCIQELQREVNNGGFNQYFYNSSGNNAHESILALKAIEANNALKIVQSAINEFPKHQVPKDRARRQTLMYHIENKAKSAWEKLDQAFYAYPDNIDSLTLVYVKNNQKAFMR